MKPRGWMRGAMLAFVLVLAGGGLAEAKESAAARQEMERMIETVTRKPLPYAEYVKLVARRGIAPHRKAKVRTVKGARTAKKPVRVTVAETAVSPARPAAKPPVVVAVPVKVPLAVERVAGWRPTVEQIHEIIRTTRNLAGANLREMNLARLDLRGVSLVGADLYHANLAGAQLDRADLRGASLEMANLRGASLQAANLAGTGLFKTNLQKADLDGANMTGVYAVCADLRGARLTSAKLRGSVFTEALLDRPLRPEEPVVAGGKEGSPALVKTAEGEQFPGRRDWWVRSVMF